MLRENVRMKRARYFLSSSWAHSPSRERDTFGGFANRKSGVVQ